MVLIMTVNVTILIILFTLYRIQKKKLSASLFFDVTVLNYFKYLITPSVLVIINVFLNIFYSWTYWYTIVVPVIVFIFIVFKETYLETHNLKKMNQFEIEIKQIIKNELANYNLHLQIDEDITVIYHRNENKKGIQVYIKSDDVTDVLHSFRIKLKEMLQKYYNTYEISVYVEKNRKKKDLKVLTVKIINQ
ncbi:hypothetical protein [Paenibacillus sp. RC67]|uniref:hypothetical protein n=1 Tax=Paenibacillus sp. RC67 TaxID=3039392 RepID=UPI0024AE0026|nr:hypothetical protein [Paenibacillus sp. RC67]